MLKPERSRPSISSPSKSRKSIAPESPTAGKIKALGLQHATSGERHPWDEQTRPSGCEPAQDASFVVEVMQCVTCWRLAAHWFCGQEQLLLGIDRLWQVHQAARPCLCAHCMLPADGPDLNLSGRCHWEVNASRPHGEQPCTDAFGVHGCTGKNERMRCRHGPLGHPPPGVVPAVPLQDDKSVETIESVLSSMTISEPKLAGSPVVYASRGLAELTGYSKEDLLGRSMFKVKCRQHLLFPCHTAKPEGTLKGRVQDQSSVLLDSGPTPRTFR